MKLSFFEKLNYFLTPQTYQVFKDLVSLYMVSLYVLILHAKSPLFYHRKADFLYIYAHYIPFYKRRNGLHRNRFVCRNIASEVGEARRIARFVIVPTNQFDEFAVYLHEVGI